jgi:hypothetical protein
MVLFFEYWCLSLDAQKRNMPSLVARVCSMKLTSASRLRPVCGGFHNLIRFNCAPFFASCCRHRVLTVTYLGACRCAAYLRLEQSSPARTLGLWFESHSRPHSRGPGFDSRRYQIFWEVVGLELGPLSLVRISEELLERKVAASA